MIELILTIPSPLQPLDSDYTLTRTLSGLTTLSFTLSSADPILPRLREESLLRDTSDGQTYRLRGIHILPEETQVSARLQLDDWEATAVTSFSRPNATAAGVLSEILPENWSLRCLQSSDDTRDVTLEFGGTPLDIAQKVQELFSCALEFDNLARTLTLSFPQSQPVSDTVLTEGADLLSRPEYTGKSTNLATRIYPVGADNVTIESVNGGTPYVENFTYTSRVIAKIWKDERYTIPAHLMAAAQELLNTLSQPELSWEISIRDLYRQDPQRWAGHKAVLGQRIRVSWQDRMITAMIVQEEIHPLYPARNTICIGAVPQTTIAAVGLLKSRLENPNSAYNSSISAAISAKIRSITPSSIGAVSNESLQTATEAALRQAKASGAFDGYSPSAAVTQTASGASITVTDQSGTTTATVENGYTPVRGVDYWTPADQSAIVAEVLQELQEREG